MWYHQILGVPDTASPDEIKKAYRALVFELHPDRNQNSDDKPQKEDRLKQINAAYEASSDALHLDSFDVLTQKDDSGKVNDDGEFEHWSEFARDFFRKREEDARREEEKRIRQEQEWREKQKFEKGFGSIPSEVEELKRLWKANVHKYKADKWGSPRMMKGLPPLQREQFETAFPSEERRELARKWLEYRGYGSEKDLFAKIFEEKEKMKEKERRLMEQRMRQKESSKRR